MMFRRERRLRSVSAASLVLAAAVFATPFAALAGGYAVVPTETIYPGEVVSGGALQEVEVTNPNLTGDYARSISEVEGLVTKRTLLPGRTISVSALREPYAVTRGSSVRLIFSVGPMTISAAGTPLQDAAIGDVIRVRNTDSGLVVSGTVLQDGTVHVVTK